MLILAQKQFIESNVLALSSIDQNGHPHNIAVAYCKVEGDKIIVSNTHIHKTIGNIKTNPHVSLAVWNKDWEKTCVGFEILGQAINHESGEWLDFVKKLPDNEGYNIKSAIVIEVQNIRQLQS